MRILLVEDDAILSKAIAKGLRKGGYAVDCAYDGVQALEQWEVNGCDLIVLDLNLPRLDGLEVLTHIRREDQEIKIIILSARGEVEDKIVGLDRGANDYLAKPFDFGELEARIRVLLLRRFTQRDTVLRSGELAVDTSRKAASVCGVELALTRKEYGILEYLLLHDGEMVGAEELIEHVWDSEADPFSNSFKVHMSSLRRKLSAVGLDQELIRNVRGHGYLLESPKGGAI